MYCKILITGIKQTCSRRSGWARSSWWSTWTCKNKYITHIL